MQNQHSFVWIYPGNRYNTLIARHMRPIRTHSPADRHAGASSGCLPNAESFLSVSTEKLPSVDGTFLRFAQQDTAIPHPYKVRPLTRFRRGISPSSTDELVAVRRTLGVSPSVCPAATDIRPSIQETTEIRIGRYRYPPKGCEPFGR